MLLGVLELFSFFGQEASEMHFWSDASLKGILESQKNCQDAMEIGVFVKPVFPSLSRKYTTEGGYGRKETNMFGNQGPWKISSH